MIGRLGIRVRLVGGGVIIALLLSAAAGLLIDAQIRRIVRTGTIAVLHSDAASYIAAIPSEPDESFDPPGSGQLVAVMDPAGALKISTLPRAIADDRATLILDDESRSVRIGGRHYVVRAVPVHGPGGTWHVIAARSAGSEYTVITQMRTLLLIGLGLVVVAVAAAAWVLSSASLTPVRRLRRTAERLSAGGTGADGGPAGSAGSRELLPVGIARDDIAALATTLNGLIAQLRESADRERRLVSDASHELRTPLAILRTQLDVALRDPASLDALVADLRPVSASAERLSRLVTSLLELSRIEAGTEASSATGRELADEAGLAVERTEVRLAEGSAIEVRLELVVADGAGAVRFGVAADDFGRLVDNLVGNSLQAIGDRPGTVLVTGVLGPEELALEVIDDGGGMSEDFAPHAAERFRRDDDARGRGGAGLGLAIVSAIVRRAGGGIRLDNRPGEGLTVRVRIPAAARDADG